MRKRRRPQWAPARVHKANRSALAVWLTLDDMATERGCAVLTPTRTQISELIKIKRLRTISTAFSILEEAGWIERVHVPVNEAGKRTATLLRIMLRRKGQYSTHTAAARATRRTKTKTRKGQNLTHTGRDLDGAVRVKKRPKGKGQNLTHDSSKEEGAPHAGFEAGYVAGRNPVPDEHPSVRIEREKLAAVRAKREADGNGDGHA